jgi:hypothetical protein
VVLGREGALWRSGGSLAIGLEVGAIPLHVGMEVEVILRIAHSGEKGGVA